VPSSQRDRRLDSIDDETCREFQAAVELVGRRWSAAILLALARRAVRFSDIRRLVAGISDPVLAQRLKELEAARLVARTVVPSTPVQVMYDLTDAGRELLIALMPLIRWRQKWGPAPTGQRGQRSRTRPSVGREQQISAEPGGGGSRGSGA
jgi:DNA-binding HxlR family transcriptional regulator